MAALTLLVMTLSSTYSPVPSCFCVDAQPTAVSNVRAKKNAEKNLIRCFMSKSLIKCLSRLAQETLRYPSTGSGQGSVRISCTRPIHSLFRTIARPLQVPKSQTLLVHLQFSPHSKNEFPLPRKGLPCWASCPYRIRVHV